MRKKIVAANWKMNKIAAEARSYIESLLVELGEATDVEVVLIPPFTLLPLCSEMLGESASVKLGAQNMHPAKSGAFTGEISASMLRDLYARYVVVGHSERRHLFGESDEFVGEKVRAAHEASLRPILCVGEKLDERAGGHVEKVIDRQLNAGLHGVGTKEMSETVIAYEPVWAIGTGHNASPEQAGEVHAHIRGVIAKLYDTPTAERVRIQYGGSVKPDNAAELMRQPDIDGALVGGASLDPRAFAAIVQAAREAKT
jgi:triosephosphate isomerase (TIM)